MKFDTAFDYLASLKNAIARTRRERTFTSIYRKHKWGRGPEHTEFFSGEGSHEAALYKPYITRLNAWLLSHEKRMQVADLGCGDFSIGRQFCQNTLTYIGVDIVKNLIQKLDANYSQHNVTFLCRDIVTDELPDAECATLRQVLQHLTNDEISQVIPKLCAYKAVIVTEHWPHQRSFYPNLDLSAGSRITRAHGKTPSGVVLWEHPFNIPRELFYEICRVPFLGGFLVSHLIAGEPYLADSED